jgi:hypothetical protein
MRKTVVSLSRNQVVTLKRNQVVTFGGISSLDEAKVGDVPSVV